MTDLPAPADLSPKLREAVRLYTDPLLPTFGNMSAAERRAGYEKGDGRHLRTKAAQQEIERIRRERAEGRGEVVEFIQRFEMDAARELVQELSTGRDLQIMDPSELLTKEDPTEEDLERAKQITNHNKVVLRAVGERRKAVLRLLAYAIGSPEQRYSVKTEDVTEKPKPLEDMDDDELMGLVQEIMSMKQKKPVAQAEEIDPDDGQDTAEEADYEVVE